MKNIILILALALNTFAQQSQQDADKLVYVPQKYVSAEGLTHQSQPNVSKWIGYGKEVGNAMNEGLAAVVDQADRFGATKVGTFVMVMVAWKVIGKDMLGVVLGLPILGAGICIWMWTLRRFFLGYRVVTKKTGFWSREYERHKAYDFASSEGRFLCGIVHVAVICVWVGLMCCVIF